MRKILGTMLLTVRSVRSRRCAVRRYLQRSWTMEKSVDLWPHSLTFACLYLHMTDPQTTDYRAGRGPRISRPRRLTK